MSIKDITSLASLRLYAYLLLVRAEDVEISTDRARDELGIASRTTWVRAREELESLGLISAERRERGYVFRLLEALPQSTEEEEDTWELRAVRIDQMADTGNKTDQYSAWGQKRKAAVAFLSEAYQQFFSEKKPATEEEVKAWLRVEERVEVVLAKLRDVAVGRPVDYPPRYILAILRKSGQEPTKPGPMGKPGQDFRTEEEARAYWLANPDPEYEALKQRLKSGKLTIKKRRWDDDNDTL